MENINNVLQEAKSQKTGSKKIAALIRENFPLFLIISGVGALWLTFWFYLISKHGVYIDSNGVDIFNGFPVLYYYIFNSVILVLSGIFLKYKFYKTYFVLSFILGISVMYSFFIVSIETPANKSLPLFFTTSLLGMVFGAGFGGPILVPMFLYSTYKSFINTIKYIFGENIDL